MIAVCQCKVSVSGYPGCPKLLEFKMASAGWHIKWVSTRICRSLLEGGSLLCWTPTRGTWWQQWPMAFSNAVATVLSEKSSGIFQAVFFCNYSGNLKLCDETVCSGTTLTVILAQFSLSFSLRKAWSPVKSVWNCPGTLRQILFIMQIPIAVLRLQHYSLLFW